MNRIRSSKSWSGFKSIFHLLISLWVLQLFFVDFKFISSAGMSCGILPGEIIMISKLHTGARTPITPLSIPFSEWFTESGVYSRAIQLEPVRFPGLFSYYLGQVVAFNRPDESNIPIDKKPFHLGRIIALPNDTIQLKKGEVFLNKKALIDMPNTLFPYSVKVKNSFRTDYFGMLGIEDWSASTRESSYFMAYMNKEQASNLMQLKEVSYAKKDIPSHADADVTIYGPKSWSLNNFGPLVLPFAGMSIELTHKNLAVYGKIMANHEDVLIENSSGAIFLNGKEESHYTFKSDYVFVLGDNLYNTIDSRHFGPVPVSHVIGSPWAILWSFKPNKDSIIKAARPDRWFTLVAQ